MARPRGDIRQRLVTAARACFLSDGVDGASLREIARRGRTSIGMLYYYFPTKDDLFLAVVEEVYSLFLADIERTLDPALTPEERLRGLYRRVGAASPLELETIRLVLREALVSSARLDQVIARFRRGHLPLMFRTVADAREQGLFGAGVHPIIQLLSTMALGGVVQILRRALDGRPELGGAVPSGEALSDLMVHILLGGIGASASSGGT